MATYGVDAVLRLVEDSDLEYPITVARLEREHALANVDIDAKGNSVMLGEVLNSADVREFTSEDDLERKLEPAFARIRSDRHTGLIGRIIRIFT